MLRHTLTLSLFLVIAAPACMAQDAHPTLQLDFIHVEKLFRNEGAPPCAMRICYERVMGHRILYGIDLHVLYRNIFGLSPSPIEDPIQYNGWTATLQQNAREWGMNYRTGYFFTGDEDGGLYIGTNIGFRHIVREVDVTSASNYALYSYTVQDSPFRPHYTEETVVFPVGLRLGIRGWEIYGAPVEIYWGLSYQIGGGKALLPQPELVDAPTTVAPITYSAGLSFLINL